MSVLHLYWPFLFCAASICAPAAAQARIPPDHPLRQMPTLDRGVAETLSKAELLGSPKVRLLLGYTRRPLYLADGYTTAMFSFGCAKEGNWLFLIDGRTLKSQRFSVPHNDVGTHGAALGADGDIYVMPYNTARAYRFRVKDLAFEQLPTDLPEGEFTWEALGGSNGCVYFGTYPNAYFGEYDPPTGKWSLWKQVAPNTKYVTGFSEPSPGTIKFKAWGPDSVWMQFDTRTRTVARVETTAPPAPDPATTVIPAPKDPALPDGEERFTGQTVVDGRRFAVGGPSGKLYEITDDAKAQVVGDTGAAACPDWWCRAFPGAVVGIGYYGSLFRYDLQTGRMERGQIDNQSAGGNAIMYLAAVTPHCVIGSNYSQQNLFRVDPESGAIVESEAPVARTTGEPMCAIGFQGKGYIGIYTQSIISVFDPKKPFTYDQNPVQIARLGEQYKQVRPRDAATDGKLVYITSDSTYNELGGALAIIHPRTRRVDVIHHLIRDQNLPSLDYDPITKLLWGGTDRWGQMRSCPPTQESALIYAFDPKTRTVVDTVKPWPGADVVRVHGVSHNGIRVASCNDQVALIHTPTREVLYLGAFPVPPPSKLLRSADGKSYCLAGDFCEWDFEQNCLKSRARTEGAMFLTESSPGAWVVADATSVYRLRLGTRQ